MPTRKKVEPKKMGRPTDYSQSIADRICERLSDGESLRDICGDADMPNKATVFRWLAKHQEFGDQYAMAREEQAEMMVDELKAIADGRDSDGDVQRDRLRVDTRKWAASKLRPKVYGDRQTIDMNVSYADLSDEELRAKAAALMARVQAD